MTTQVTRSGPRASTASSATSAESIPPERASADVAEAVLRDVVAQAEDERAVDLGEVGERLGDPARAGRQATSQTSSSSSNCAARAITSPLGSRTKLWPSKTSSSWPPTRLQKAKWAP